MKNSRNLIWILLLAGLIRLLYVFTLQEKYTFSDTLHYDSAAKSILAGDGFGPSLHYYDRYDRYCLEPMYPLFLAGIYTVFGESFLAVRIVQSLLSLLQIVVIYRLTLLLYPPAAIVALLFSVIYPLFIYISGLLYSTQLFSLLLTLIVYFFVRYTAGQQLKWLIFGGLAFGLSIATIPVIAPAGLLFVLWIGLITTGNLFKRLLPIACFGLVTALVLAPWSIRNYMVFGVASPGRACMAEARAFEQINLQFKYEDSFKQPVFEGKQFRVEIEDIAGDRPQFKYFLDDEYLGTLKIVDQEWRWPASRYYGLMAYGGTALHFPLPEFRYYEQNKALSSANFIQKPELIVSRESLSLDTTPEKWDYNLVFTQPDSFTHLTLTFPEAARPADIQRVAFLIGLDEPSLTADGYMIWFHPWKAADLWQIRDGKPFRSVEVVDLERKKNPMTLKRLIAAEPIRYLFRHFIPEWIRYWSPVLNRITSPDYQPGKMQKAASLIFTTPLLLFSVIGVVAFLKRNAKHTILLLIPMVVLSCGYALFFAEVRYRIPVDAFLIVFASIGLFHLKKKNS
ncbi:MAG: hypothetical protein EHM72_05715 [Calditrichaeota bacterium]|nr:MAG: hypothetical protein EHM72_05715 [Calditrichota bacterium]